MPAYRCLLVFAILLFAAAPLYAQEAATDPPDPGNQSDQDVSGQSDPASANTEGTDNDASLYADRKKYLVEVITFRYLGPDSSAGETFDRLFVEDYLPTDPFDIDEYNRVREAVAYTDMDKLAGTLEKLRLDRRYQVISNVAWVQPLLARNEAINVPLGYDSRTERSSLHAPTASPASSRLSGSLRVYGDYLLFVDIDLKVTLPRRAEDSPTADADRSLSPTVIGGTPISSNDPDSRFGVFHLSEKRRIKLEEFHYFDHPRFGAIVSVVRHEDEPEQG